MLWNRSLEKSINRGAGKTREARQFVFLSFLKRMFDVVLMRKEIACLTVFCLGLLVPYSLNAQEAVRQEVETKDAVLAEAAQADDSREKVDYPEADIFLIEINKSDAGDIKLGPAKNVTDRPGYDNQPFFTKDSQSFLYSRSDDFQTDVYEYFIETGNSVRVTNSKNMEFSPTPSPNNKKIAFVTDGEGANQSIWFANRDSIDQPQWLLKNQPEREPVGYFSWNHESGYALFWSRYGHSLRLVHESKELSHYITGHAVPATPWIIPGTDKFSFVHRQANGEVWIKELSPTSRSVRPLVMLPAGTHYNWSPDGSVWMVQNGKIVRWKEGDDAWKPLLDLEPAGIKNASRVALSDDGKWLAVVGVPVE
jgi:hypothetical protein